MVTKTRKFSDDEIEEIAKWMLDNKATVRKAEAHFHISKSTIHRYCRVELKKINFKLAAEIGNLLDRNRESRHLRGGEATRSKCLKMKKR